MSRKITASAVENAILSQAREDMKFARAELKEFHQRVGRTFVKGTDRYEYMNGVAYYQVKSSLDTLSTLCDELDLDRLGKIIERHVERITGEFEELSKRDREQVCAARDAEHKATLAELRGR